MVISSARSTGNQSEGLVTALTTHTGVINTLFGKFKLNRIAQLVFFPSLWLFPASILPVNELNFELWLTGLEGEIMLGYGRCGLNKFLTVQSCLMIHRASLRMQYSKDYIADLCHILENLAIAWEVTALLILRLGKVLNLIPNFQEELWSFIFPFPDKLKK